MTDAVHATAVAIDGWAVMLTGKSGVGKSDLALRLIDRGAELICDDYVALIPDRNRLMVTAMANIAGIIEVRGLGIFPMPHIQQAPLRLIVQLGKDGERHPESWPLLEKAGFAIPLLKLNAYTASASIKVEMALKSLIDASILPMRRLASEAQP
jgi:serine kinase of HPr protein (carbohydrate metabolism regulator)